MWLGQICRVKFASSSSISLPSIGQWCGTQKCHISLSYVMISRLWHSNFGRLLTWVLLLPLCWLKRKYSEKKGSECETKRNKSLPSKNRWHMYRKRDSSNAGYCQRRWRVNYFMSSPSLKAKLFSSDSIWLSKGVFVLELSNVGQIVRFSIFLCLLI